MIYSVAEKTGEAVNTLTGSRVSMQQLPNSTRGYVKIYKKIIERIVEPLASKESGLMIEFYIKFQNLAIRSNLFRNLANLLVIAPFFSTIIFTPLIEELFFRLPVVFVNQTELNVALSIISSIAFAIAHEVNYTLDGGAGRETGLVAMGLMLSFIANKEGLLTAILVHSGHNLFEWIRRLTAV